MKKKKFLWWTERLSFASRFYDLYRIDHAVGLFRLFSIPQGCPASEGHFVPADPNLWGEHGQELLEMMLSASPMLPIAEDLGTIPPIVRTVLAHLGIPGTKVMRWERLWDKGEAFIEPKDYPAISLTCVSTHDSPTLGQWWRDFPQEASVYAKQYNLDYKPLLSQDIRIKILKSSLSSNSLFRINLLLEYLALVPDCVHSNPDKERINIPGKQLPSNWVYKMKKPVEELLNHEPLHKAIANIFPFT